MRVFSFSNSQIWLLFSALCPCELNIFGLRTYYQTKRAIWTDKTVVQKGFQNLINKLCLCLNFHKWYNVQFWREVDLLPVLIDYSDWLHLNHSNKVLLCQIVEGKKTLINKLDQIVLSFVSFSGTVNYQKRAHWLSSWPFHRKFCFTGKCLITEAKDTNFPFTVTSNE